MKHQILIILLLFSFIFGYSQEKTAGFYMRRAYNKINTGDYKGALRDYNEAITLNPDDPSVFSNRGLLKARYLKDYWGAIQDFDKAILLNPDDASAYYNRGVFKNDAKDYEGAEIDYSRAAELMPKFATVYYKRGGVRYFYLQDQAGGCADWEKAGELGAKNVEELIAKYCKD